MDQRFPGKHKLKLKRDFDRVFKTGRRAYADHFMLIAAPGPDLGHHRLGISVGRKVGNAVARNRIKRMTREFYRMNKKEVGIAGMISGADMMVVVRRGAADIDFHVLCKELEICWRKLQSPC